MARLIHNPILKGVRWRNQRISRRVNKTGRRKSVKAPAAEQLFRAAPHLAFVDAARYDRLIRLLFERNGRYARGRAAGTPDGRAGVPKKRTVWPGQHVVCGVCGRTAYWGSHGQAERMACAGVRDYACWNVASFDGHDAGRRLASAVLAAAEALPGFDAAFLARVQAAAAVRGEERTTALERLDREISQVDRDLKNLLDAVAADGLSIALRDRLHETEARKGRLDADRTDRLARPSERPDLPPVGELKARARAVVGRMAFCDPAFGRLMRDLLPRIIVFPVRPVDGGAVVLRACVTVNLASLAGPAAELLGGVIAHDVVVDLFDPPQCVAFRERVIALAADGRPGREVAAALGLTLPAVQHALALDRRMRVTGTTDPYELLTAPPDDFGRARRHRHPRYAFRPLPGYPAWPVS